MVDKQNILGIIPARFSSTRFPGKPLAMIRNKPMVQWVYEACSDRIDNLVVATDDERICQAVSGFGGQVMMTSPDHNSGTERCYEVYREFRKNKAWRGDLIINIQGDEPLIRGEQIDELIHCMAERDTDIVTLAKKLPRMVDPGDPGTVKVVTNKHMHALYFSRSPIPYYRGQGSGRAASYLQHTGIYGYKPEVLEEIMALPASELEKAEQLEQLRWLENGYSIGIQYTEYQNIGIDTPEDLKKLEKFLSLKD
ncbi:MAG: 3-deoxy-manno-octulosonate cytidylyltransferase [Bacteroidales bacterium]|nr:3-deoxy-manno-octulosonate cytidylyltransferase [Bacteroidales bacterium]